MRLDSTNYSLEPHHISASLVADNLRPDVKVPYEMLPLLTANGPLPADLITQAGQLVGTPTERIAELASRVCYDSLGRGRNSAALHKHLLDVNHGCFDGDTEVLTVNGWKPWPDVSVHDDLCTRAQDGSIVYQKPTKLHAWFHSGRMYRVSGAHIDLLVTDNHRMLVSFLTTRAGRRRESYEMIEAQYINGRPYSIPKCGEWRSGSSVVPAPVARLLGFAIGDGYIGPRHRPVRFHLRRERKIRFLLANACEAGWAVREAANDTWILEVPDSHRALFDAIYDDEGEKVIPAGVLCGWDKSSLLALYDGLINSDGSVSDTSVVYDTKSEVLAGQFQQLALHIGLASNISQAPCYLERERPLYRNTVIRRCLSPDVDRCGGTGARSEWISQWQGMVYCATVPNGTLYVRRNGKTAWTGNSVYEHVNHTFALLRVPSSMELCLYEILANRPGVWISRPSSTLLVCCNLRTLIDWYAWSQESTTSWEPSLASQVYTALHAAWLPLAPQVVSLLPPPIAPHPHFTINYIDPPHGSEEHQWVTLFLSGSRGFSHEMVRHGDRTAISQRSTRYVDENDSPWVAHPLIRAYSASGSASDIDDLIAASTDLSTTCYELIVARLEAYLQERSVDKLTARKQARGAARGMLGNALKTEMIFSASVAQWKRILRQRLHPAADAEIREVASHMLRELRDSAYKEAFNTFNTKPSPDGIGVVLDLGG